jgi:GntR family transcriptional regulator
MIIDIQHDGSIPIHEQIVAQMIYGIASKALEVGTMIPSVRELARTLLVHPNTVAKAFGELERRGMVVARRGLGMEVTQEAPTLCRAERQELVRQRIRQAIREAVFSALPAEMIRKLVEEELARSNGERRSRESR